MTDELPHYSRLRWWWWSWFRPARYDAEFRRILDGLAETARLLADKFPADDDLSMSLRHTATRIENTELTS